MGNESSKKKLRNMESAAANILKRAVEMDMKEQYTMALALYLEGVQILVDSIKETKDVEKANHYKGKADQYLKRAEELKKNIQTRKNSGTYRELMKIPNGGIGYGYATVFGRFLDREVTSIRVEDPYIRMAHQCQNLVRLCELAVKQCPALSRISLVTTREPENKGDQITRLNDLKTSLESRLIAFDYTFSETLHDRQITLSNGWIIKIGRGLDYFKAPKSMYVLGAHDLELRNCLETTVDIFHQSSLRGEGS